MIFADCQYMAIQKLHIEPFLELAKQHPVLDVRSPGEYKHAHIPGAYNLPLFSDEERKVVGTAYKQTGREHAIKIGLDYFGPKMRKIVEETESIVASLESGASSRQSTDSGLPATDSRLVLLHCWRGGMRSAGVAWLLDLYGFKVYTLIGGYKKFRQYILETFSFNWQFNILGGYTGSGKTEMLHELATLNQPVIDLEALANHKGSAFGNLGMLPQPSQEMFENLLGTALRKQSADGSIQSIASNDLPTANCIWLEDESQRIGDVNIPQPLWLSMRKARLFFIDIPFEERLKHIVDWYGKQDRERIINGIMRIKKRLGGLETKTAINYLVEDNIPASLRVLLTYYDKWYLKSLHTRENPGQQITNMTCAAVNEKQNVQMLLKHAQTPVLK